MALMNTENEINEYKREYKECSPNTKDDSNAFTQCKKGLLSEQINHKAKMTKEDTFFAPKKVKRKLPAASHRKK